MYLFMRAIRVLSAPLSPLRGWERKWLLASVRRVRQVERKRERKVKRGLLNLP